MVCDLSWETTEYDRVPRVHSLSSSSSRGQTSTTTEAKSEESAARSQTRNPGPDQGSFSSTAHHVLPQNTLSLQNGQEVEVPKDVSEAIDKFVILVRYKVQESSS